MQKRLIDQLPSHSSTFQSKVSILVLNAPRTGSTSLAVALEQLGYKVYSAMHYGFSQANHFPLWSEAVDAKFFDDRDRQIKPYDRQDWDKMFGEFEVVRGLQPACFGEDLIAAYPEAKVVYCTRDVDDWVDSMERTVGRLLNFSTLPLLAWLEMGTKRDFYYNARRIFAAWSGFESWWGIDRVWDREALKRSYLRRHDNIRELVPPERLLNFRPQDGWDPLCRFLERDPPQDQRYPHSMGHDELTAFTNGIWRETLWGAVKNVGMVIGAGIVPLMLAHILRK